MPRPARPWFRFYVEAVHDRKLRRQKPEHRWLFVVCLAAARQSPDPGWLLVGEDDPMRWDDLVDFAAMPLRQVEQGADALQDAGVLGYDQEREAWFIPNWNERQFESDDVTARTAKHRSKERSNVVRGNAPDTETDSDTETSSSSSVTETGLPADLWMRVAEKRAQTTTSRIADPVAWKRKAATNAQADLEQTALGLVSRYELSPSQLCDALVAGGSPPWLNQLRRKDPA